MRFTGHKKSGFTLVEMIIYIAFFAILSILAIEALMVVMRSFYTLRLTQNINQSATTALERMSREVRNAYDIDTAGSTFNANPGHLTLRTKDAGGANTTVEFYVNGSQIGIKEGGVDKGSLMEKSTTVTNLIFRQITTANSKAIKIEMSLHDTHGVLSRDAVFYDTILLRGSTH
jgi:type II secretory pathway component PulJ